MIKRPTKNELLEKLDEIFNLTYDNMNKISPSGNSKEEDYKLWKQCTINQLDNKQWILALDEDRVVGYLFYEIKDTILNINEVQLDDSHKGDKVTFKSLLKEMINIDLSKVTSVRAVINNNNTRALHIASKMQLEKTGERNNSSIFIGQLMPVLEYINSK